MTGCVLPGWAGEVLGWLVIVVAFGTGVFASSMLSKVGARRHPRMDFTDSHHRRWWDSGGVLLGLVAFAVVALLLGETGRAIACDLIGTYPPPPDYSWP